MSYFPQIRKAHQCLDIFAALADAVRINSLSSDSHSWVDSLVLKKPSIHTLPSILLNMTAKLGFDHICSPIEVSQSVKINMFNMGVLHIHIVG